MKFIFQILTLLILTLTVQNCATFPKSSFGQKLLIENDLTRINGQYKVRAEKDSLLDNTYIDSNSAFEKFYRGKERGSRDTMKTDNLDNYLFDLKLVENQKIEVTYLQNKISFRKITLEYKLKNDGYIYLKNKNFKISGIPFLFGGIDIRKLRLTKIDNYLIIEEVHHSSGALLLIFGDSKTWDYTHRYERIE